MASSTLARSWHLSKPPSIHTRVNSPQRRIQTSYLNYVNSTDEEILELLNSEDFEVRLRVLNRLRNMSQANQSWFKKFQKKRELFQAFGSVLSDSNWEVQHQCIKFLADTMNQYGEDLDWCMTSILPLLVPKLGSSKITVRRVTVQALQNFLKNTDSIQQMESDIVFELLQNRDLNAVQEILRELPHLFMPLLSERNWSILVDGLTKMLANADNTTSDLILTDLDKLLELIDQYEFNQIIQALPEKQRNNYEVMVMKRGRAIRASAQRFTSRSLSNLGTSVDRSAKQYRCGIIPVVIWDQLQNETEPKIRIASLEQLKSLIENLDQTDIKQFLPHLATYFNMLSNVLDDLNFKVVVLSLETLRISVSILQNAVEPHLQHIITAMTKHLGNQKTVIKQINMMTSVDLMHHLQPKTVITPLCSNLQHRNSRVREEVLNIITAALLKFPSDDFNLTAIAYVLSPLLADPKRRVRLAAFEQVSVLAQNLGGPGKLEPLFKCVREVEHRQRVPGLMIAVQSRLARHQLPRIRYDGLIEYSVPHASPVPKSPDASLADYDWIMSGAVGPGSAISRSLSPGRLGPATQPLPPAPLHRSPPISEPQSLIKRQSSIDTNPVVWENGETDEQEETQSAPPATMESGTPLGGRSIKPEADVVRKTNSHQHHHSFSDSGAEPRRRKLSPPGRRISYRRSDRTRSIEDPDALATSLDRVRFNAVKKRQQSRDAPSFPKSQSADALESNWDDQPIRPAKNIPNGYTSHNSKPKHYSPRRRSSSEKKPPPKNNFSSATSTDTRQTVLSEPPAGGRPQPFVARKIAVKKPPPARPQPPQKPVKAPQMDQNPQMALQNALKKIASEDWTPKVEGITTIQRLAQSSPNTLNSDLHTVAVTINNEAKNLRSSVSKAAIDCLGQLFLGLKLKMDPEVDKAAAVLMQKTGDVSSAFIRDDALQSLEFMVDFVTPSKSANAIVATGGNSKSIQIRSACGQLLCRLVENLGASKTLGQKDICDKVLPQFYAFAIDNNPQPRFHGKSGLQMLAKDGSNFSKATRRLFNERQISSIQELIDKKIADAPPPSNSHTPALSTNQSQGVSRVGSIRRKPQLAGKLPDHIQDSVDLIKADLTSNGWEERLKGISGFESMCKNHSKAVASDLKLVEHFVARLNDINGKVATQALQTHLIVMPQMGHHFSNEHLLKTAISDMTKHLMAQLPCKNGEVSKLAEHGLDACVKYIDNSVLIIGFSMTTRAGNIKQKPKMLPRLSRICNQVYRPKPKLVELHAMPILWDLVKSQQGDLAMKQETANFAKSLSKTMGKQTLLSQANGLSPGQKQELDKMIA